MKHISKFLAAALAVAGFTGCSDYVQYNNIEELPKGIYISIPDPLSGDINTRALDGGDPAETVGLESKLNDLWLFAFDVNGQFYKCENILANLDPVKFHSETGHKTYNITEWFEGSTDGTKYKLYLVANLGAYTSNTTWQAPANEAALTSTIVNFRNGETAYLLNHGNVKTTGLPMACLNSEISVRDESGTHDGQGLTIVPGGNAFIHADLKFLCSKVRYTILFDNSTEGFSYGEFGTKFVNFTSATATGLCEGTQTVGSDAGTASGTFSLSSIALNSVEYPADPNTYPSTAELSTNLTKVENPTGAKRAWQGVVYLPANADISKATTLTFSGNIDGNGSVKYNLPLVPNATSSAATKPLNAGKYFDVVVKVTGLQTISVTQPTVETDWNRTQLLYSLMQNLFLRVNPTAIDKVEAGKTYSMYYSSNGEVKFESPKYNGVEVYEHKFEGDSIYINVNPEIKAAQFSAIMSGDYKWFEVNTGGGIITKRIDIKELDLRRFLNITPDKFAININELVASGSYNNPENATEFEVETNVESFWIEMENWPNNTNAQTNHLWIEVQDPDTKSWSVVKCFAPGSTPSDNDKIKVTDGSRIFRLRYEGLNSGYPIWESGKEYKLSFKVDNSGMAANQSISPVGYQVDIIPSYDKYIIHVKSKGNFLSYKKDGKEYPPHCYIYQCLEVPSTYTGTWKKDGVETPLANWPVAGVNANNQDDETKYNANVSALEYSFTGKVAFRGWDWDKNAETLRKCDVNDNHTKLHDNGWHWGQFIRFNGDWSELTNSEDRYNTGMDFFEQYRNDVSRCLCDDCRDKYNTGWPGLMMENEGNDWYKLELTGSATPGRALIIWTNMHSKGDGIVQYPKDAGVRLFDFPSKEAWIFIESDSKASQWFQTKADADKYASEH